MKEKFASSPLWEETQHLSAVAQGKRPADVVLEHGVLINVCTHELQKDISVAIAHGRIAYVGADASHTIGEGTQRFDVKGAFIAPGFLDGHIHVESSMVGVSEYARATVPHGTVGIYMDPHEICNVCGLDGVRLMDADATRVPLKTMITTPSCVPAVPGFEDTGAAITPEDVRETMTWDSVIGLGEMMNFPGILSGADHPHREVAETLKAGLAVTGHWATPEHDQGLNAYIASGVSSCHESTRAEDALAKMRLGMYAMFREGSAWHDLHALAPVITEHDIDTRFALLVSDDNHPHTLLERGHVDYLIRRAREEGIDLITAVQMVTINCATAFGMQTDLGSVTPGKCADIVIFEDAHNINVTHVFINGELVAKDGKPLFSVEPFDYPHWATHSMHIRDAITPQTFQVKASQPEADEAHIRVIEVAGGRVPDTEVHMNLPIVEGKLESSTQLDVLKTFVFERHHDTGSFGVGFVKGFGIEGGAMASTVAHDAHNLLVIGTNDEDMALAANTLIDSQGGQVIVRDGEIIAHVPLPVAGLMSDQPVEVASEQVRALEAAWEKIGCKMPSPFMTMALIPLACIPDLRLTNRGLVDCNTFTFVDLEVK